MFYHNYAYIITGIIFFINAKLLWETLLAVKKLFITIYNFFHFLNIVLKKFFVLYCQRCSMQFLNSNIYIMN